MRLEGMQREGPQGTGTTRAALSGSEGRGSRCSQQGGGLWGSPEKQPCLLWG